MNWSFKDKVALVTGAASGIGLATAKAFAEAGAAVTLADVHEDAVRSAVEELVAAGHKAIRSAAMSPTRLRWQPWSSRPSPYSVAWMRHSTMPACSPPAVETADASVEEFDRVNAINLSGVSTA